MTSFDDIIQSVDKETLCIKINCDVYSLEAIFKTCYWYTEKCYLYLDKSNNIANVYLKVKQGQNVDLQVLAGEFLNDLINQRVRSDVTKETGKIRELIVAQAFAEGNLLPGKESEATSEDYLQDSLSITSLKGK